MSALQILIKKNPDGSAAISCRRTDGSVTWQRQDGPRGRFFPLHDLTHYAVETVLGYSEAFYGLVAIGWSFPDFGKPWPRGPLPPPAVAAELIVGFLDLERAAGAEWSADELNRNARTYAEERKAPTFFTLSEAELRRIRSERRTLFARWAALAAGETLELPFPERADTRP